MKKITYLLFLIPLTAILFFSCKNDNSYAEELEAEKTLIKNYIKRNGITVLDKFPVDSVSFPENAYVLTSSGLYYRLNKQGTGRDVEVNDEIVTRYYEYTLNENPEIYDYWDPQLYPDPYVFSYMNLSRSSVAFHEAVGYMKKSGAEAELIVPTKIGFNPSGEVVIPYGYKMKIQFKSNSISQDNE